MREIECEPCEQCGEPCLDSASHDCELEAILREVEGNVDVETDGFIALGFSRYPGRVLVEIRAVDKDGNTLRQCASHLTVDEVDELIECLRHVADRVQDRNQA